jgi:hypothetical protein
MGKVRVMTKCSTCREIKNGPDNNILGNCILNLSTTNNKRGSNNRDCLWKLKDFICEIHLSWLLFFSLDCHVL